MTDIIQELHSEHAQMAELLTILEREIDRLDSGGSPDYEIVEAILAYFLDYPDLCHHPKEDVIAKRLRNRSQVAAKMAEKLITQHVELAALSRSFAKVVEQVLGEAEMPRERVVAAGRDFIAAQRRHMEKEEQHFLPMARDLLSPLDLAELRSELPERKDPLFGAEVKKRFEALRADIENWAVSRAL